VGVKNTLTSRLCPAGNVCGRFTWDNVISRLLELIPDTNTSVAPLFVSLTCKLSVCPTTTAPKRKRGGEQVSGSVPARAFSGVAANAIIRMIKM
jgi:hypothetical protein